MGWLFKGGMEREATIWSNGLDIGDEEEEGCGKEEDKRSCEGGERGSTWVGSV